MGGQKRRIQVGSMILRMIRKSKESIRCRRTMRLECGEDSSNGGGDFGSSPGLPDWFKCNQPIKAKLGRHSCAQDRSYTWLNHFICECDWNNVANAFIDGFGISVSKSSELGFLYGKVVVCGILSPSHPPKVENFAENINLSGWHAKPFPVLLHPNIFCNI